MRSIAGTLVGRYDWSEAGAVGLILTDQPPFVGIQRATTHSPGNPTRCTIALTVPYWASASDVADAYLEGRRELLDRGAPKLRPLSEKSSALMFFVSERLDTDGKPNHDWKRIWRDWIAEYPEWGFPDAQRLNSEYRRLVKAVCGARRGPTLTGTIAFGERV
ncbi:hypothetical protein CMK11_01380 [Candidatus Poribacteria bacterium]|nr:hypothetical protein [Candidatus Poribacteria bacterium]